MRYIFSFNHIHTFHPKCFKRYLKIKIFPCITSTPLSYLITGMVFFNNIYYLVHIQIFPTEYLNVAHFSNWNSVKDHAIASGFYVLNVYYSWTVPSLLFSWSYYSDAQKLLIIIHCLLWKMKSQDCYCLSPTFKFLHGPKSPFQYYFSTETLISSHSIMVICATVYLS